MSQSVLLKAAGLYTFPNSLSEIPPGSLTVADNVVIDRNGIIEPRRGFQQYGGVFGIGTDRAKQLMTYKNRIFRHYGSTIDYDDGFGGFTPFAGDYLETEIGLRIKYIEANGNFYFTTAAGIECVSALTASQFSPATSYVRTAGAAQALDVNGIVDYTNGGWFIYQTSTPGQTKVAYRVTWGFNDANDNFVEGVPSSRLVLTNYSEVNSADVTLSFQIPSEITTTDTQYFYRIYRTGVVQTSVGVTLNQLDPGDEEYLVIQDFPTPAELISRTVTVTDVTPESFRANGSLLYTNPISGEGILQSNYRPPIAKDINLFQSTVFYANTQTIQSLSMSLLSTLALVSGTSSIFIGSDTTLTAVSSPGLVTGNTINIINSMSNNESVQYSTSGTIITGLTNNGTYFVINATPTSFQLSNTFGGPAIVLTSDGVGTQNFVVGNQYTLVGTKQVTNFTFGTKAAITDGGYFLINSANDERKYFVWFTKSGANEITNFTFDPFATMVNGGYFLLNSSGNTTRYFVWFDTSPGGTTPAPTGADTVGKTGIKVQLTAGQTAAQVAQAVANQLPVSNFNTTLNTNILTVSNTSPNATIDATAGLVAPGPGYVNTVVQQGVNPTAQPSGADTIGRLPINVDITLVTTAADVALAVSNTLNLNGSDFVSNPIAPGSATIQVTNGDNGSATAAAPGTVPPGGGFAITPISTGTGENASIQQVLLGNNISPAISIDETARSLVKVINANPNETVSAFYTSGPTDLPGQFLLQARTLSQGSFSLTANSTVTGNEFNPAIPISGTSLASTNLVELNALYYSKFQQPEAVPIVNKFNVGPKDKAILRILPLRTGLMILKEDGIYRLTGVNGQFNIDPFDNSAICLAADSAQVLNNQIYMFSTQGVVTLTDTGVSVISRPIEDFLQKIITPAFDYKPNTFGVAYESDRAYLLWTVTNSNDTVPTQCFRFNTFTTAWTRWPISKTCGLVKFDDQLMYLGAGDVDFIEQERKNINRTDYADRIFPVQIPSSAIVSDTEIILSSTADVEDGDVLVQTQFLTIYQFNQLLKMLDADLGTGYKNYFATLGQTDGANLRDSLDNLANKLDTDTGLAESDFFSSIGHGTSFFDYQTDFNILVGLLNANPNTLFKNYPESVGTVAFDVLIITTIPNTNNVIIKYPAPIIQGELLLFRGIKTDIVWAPQTFNDPSISKHVSEGTFMFENTVFSTATISYASDLMPSFETTSFDESGIGDWGGFVWGEQYWGGEGSSVPLRTYIPRNKQYCRFLRPRFQHVTAREKFSLLGGSLTFRPLTERAYRS